MWIAGGSIGGTFRIIEISGMFAPDARQQSIQRLNATPAVPRRPIGLGPARATKGGQQDTCQDYEKNMPAHGVFVRPGT